MLITPPENPTQLRVKLLGESPRHVRPLSETKAIESGANFLSEGVGPGHPAPAFPATFPPDPLSVFTVPILGCGDDQ